MEIIIIGLTAVFILMAGLMLLYRIGSMRARELATQGKLSAVDIKNYLFHKSHTWLNFLKNETLVGIDSFTHRLIGKIDKIECPEIGTTVTKGKRLWTIKFGSRTLNLASPITGRIVGINREVLVNPDIASKSPYGTGWVVKIVPDKLSGKELEDLHNPWVFKKLIDSQIAQYFHGVFPDLGLVYGDGGEIIPGAAKYIDQEKWEEFAEKIFGSQKV